MKNLKLAFLLISISLIFSTCTSIQIPEQLSLLLPIHSIGVDPTPTIRVQGVMSDLTIKIFTASDCTNEVGSATASSDTVDVTTDPLTPGSYNFYANATDSGGAASACSTNSVAYTLENCPTNFIRVPSLSPYNFDEFCVAKYEMKVEGDDTGIDEAWSDTKNAESRPTGTPWTGMEQTQAKTSCEDMNSNNGVTDKYYLITNNEWMTIARDIESTATNWSNGTIGGSEDVSRGHADMFPASALAASADDNDPCFGQTHGESCDGSTWHIQRRIHTLSNGQIIWDLSGNVYEWIDWNVTGAQKAGAQVGWGPFDWVEVNDPTPTTEMPASSFNSADTNLDAATNAIGRYCPGDSTQDGAAIRGGSWTWDSQYAVYAGIYMLRLNGGPTFGLGNIGFRCVYRPWGAD